MKLTFNYFAKNKCKFAKTGVKKLLEKYSTGLESECKCTTKLFEIFLYEKKS